jgi:tetratricopeptide (TPR) repeat protein
MNRISANSSLYFPLLIIAVGLMAYCTSFQVPFTFDDEFNIVNNPAIKDFRHVFDPLFWNKFPQTRIVGYLSLALNYRLHGLDVSGYHVVNLAVHIANGLLVYLLVGLIFRTPWFVGRLPGRMHMSDAVVALFAALLFVAHPVQTQAVTYVIQRLASLATFFYLLSLVSYLKARLLQTQGIQGKAFTAAAFHILALFSAVLAMKTKEIAFTLPVMAVCCELIFFRGPFARRLLGLLPMALTIFVIPLTLLRNGTGPQGLISEVGEVTRVMTPISRLDYLLTQFRVIVTYLRLLVFPVEQRVDYDYPLFHSLLNPQVLASLFLLLTLAGIAAVLLVQARRGLVSDQGRSRLVAFCILWFFITLSVESSIIPIADVIFEHRLYLSAVGFCILIPLLISTYLPRGAEVLLVCLVVLLGGATIGRNMLWGDEVRLWQDNLAKSPDKGRVYIQLGKAYRKIGRNDLTIETYNQWLAKDPNDPEAYNNRGNAYRNLGMPGLALEDYNHSIALAPNFGLPHFNRATLYLERREFSRAIADYLRAQSLDPALEKRYSNLGYAYEELGQHDKAIEAYTREIARNPASGEAYYNRSVVYRRKGMPQESETDLREARRLGVRR